MWGKTARAGYSLVELLVVVAIFALAAASLVPFSGSFVSRQTLRSYRIDVGDTLRRAQHRSLIGERDSAWGVRFATGSYVLFAGTSYAARNASLDTTRTLREGYAFSGLSEVTFIRGTGEPDVSGTLFITYAQSGGREEIEIGERGAILLPFGYGYASSDGLSFGYQYKAF
jgi:prepilin-type N-terminal cleavage/methylation domain-containing protein